MMRPSERVTAELDHPTPATEGNLHRWHVTYDNRSVELSDEYIKTLIHELMLRDALVRKMVSEEPKKTIGDIERPPRPLGARDLKIMERYNAGETQAQIAASYGLTQPAVSRIIRTHGST